MTFGLSLLAFFLVLGPLILIHELGHFWSARAFGIRVDEFGIGFPPRMVKLFEKKGTEFTLNWIPLGGFNKLAGEDDPDIPGGFAQSSKIARLVTLVSGPLANIIAALGLFMVMFMFGAPEVMPGAVVSEVMPDTPAMEAGLLKDDIILEADGSEIDAYTDIIAYVTEKKGEEIHLLIERDGELIDAYLTPRTEWPAGQGPTGIAVQSNYKVVSHGFFDSFGMAFQEFGRILKSMVEIPAMAIRGEIEAKLLRPVSVVGISQLGGQAIEASIQESLLWPIINLAAFISIALGITNLLPLPALDGGRILFILIEAIRGKRIEPEKEALVHFIGFMLLMAVMLITVYFDIVDPLI